MKTIAALTTLTICLAGPALAQDRTFACTMTEACRTDGGNCVPEDLPYNFTLNPTTGVGEMEQRIGNFFDGTVYESDGALHFLFVNSAGVELATLADTGGILFTGNMALGSDIVHYRLNGTCRETTGGAAGGASGSK